jgi:threonine/homoserine/homoserine lactone efflux protein
VSDLLLPLLTFVVAMTITPGPNNIMITASGANFGFRRTIPHLMGIVIGFPVMTLAIGVGLGELFKTWPIVHTVLKYAGTAYLLYLAYRIATAARGGEAQSRGRPLTFLEAAAFQWANPKGWMMAVGAISAYTTVGGNPFLESLIIAATFGVIAVPAVGVWAVFGVAVGRLLRSDRALRIFNLTMAALLVASLALLYL